MFLSDSDGTRIRFFITPAHLNLADDLVDDPTKGHHKSKPVVAGTVHRGGEVQDEDGRQFDVEELNPVVVVGAQGMIKDTIPCRLDTPAGGKCVQLSPGRLELSQTWVSG